MSATACHNPASKVEKSTTITHARAFITCLRNSFHNHFHHAAHSINPGTSIITNELSARFTTPRFGISVVK